MAKTVIDLSGDQDEAGIQIELPSGARFTAVTPEEVDLVRERIDRYQQDFELTNISDQSDIDSIVQMEVLVQRWNNYISSGVDAFDTPIDPELPKRVKDYSQALISLKKQLGVDRVTRDKNEGENSVATYITELLRRAKQFGVNREEQSAKAIELANELIHLVQLYDHSTEQERKTVAIDKDGILDWIRDEFTPQFQAIDKYFREHVQSTWIREQ